MPKFPDQYFGPTMSRSHHQRQPSNEAAQHGLVLLKKEYRNMEVNRKSYTEDSRHVLSLQQQKLEKLRTENESIRADISTLQSRNSQQPLTKLEQEQLAKLYEESSVYKSRTEQMKTLAASTQEKIFTMRKQIWEHRRSTGGVNAEAENQQLIDKQRRMLENRLDQALVKFNKSLANNRKLRKHIDDLRGERFAFDGVSKKLERNLSEKKQRMAELIEQSNHAYEARDRAQLETMAIGQANRKEHEAFDQQMMEMRKQLDEELQLTSTQPKPDPEAIAADEVTKVEEERKAAIAMSLAAEKEALALKRRDRLKTFEEAFRKISVTTGVSDVDHLVRSFNTTEEQTFSLYSYMTEQTREIDKLKEQLQDIRRCDDAIQAQKESDDISCHQKHMRDLDTQVNEISEETTKFERKCQEAQMTSTITKDAIRLLLTRIDCLDDIAGGGEGITDRNMTACLGAIEEKVNYILSKFHSICGSEETASKRIISTAPPFDAAAPSMGTNLLGTGPVAPMSLEPMYVNPPKLADYSSDDDSGDEGRPLTRSELQNITEDRLGNAKPHGRRRLTLAETAKRARRRSSVVTNMSVLPARRSIVGDVLGGYNGAALR